MVNVHDYAHSLARALKQSGEYQGYAAAKRRLDSNQSAQQMVADFHKKQIELQAAILQGGKPSDAQQEALERLYTVIQGSADARDYLAAEQRLATILNDIYRIIGEAVDLQLPAGKAT